MDTPKRSSAFLFGYGIGDFGLNIYWNSLSLILVFWYADVVGLNPRDAGTIFALGVLWDAISDPIVAALAERNKSRYGTYRPFVLFGSVILGGAFMFLFWVPPWQGTALFVHLVLAHILFRTAYTIVAVPYSAMTARITYSSQERSDLSGVRMGFAFLGLLAISWLWFPLTRYFGDGQESSATGSFMTALVGGVVATIALLACFAFTREKPVLGGTTRTTDNLLKNLWKAVTRNRALRILLLLIFVNSAAGLSSSIPLAFYIEANAETFANKEVIFTTLAIVTLSVVPVWTLIIRVIGKKKSWALGSGLLIASGLHWAVFGPAVMWGIPMQMPVMALGGSAFSIVIWAIIPNTVEYGQHAYGERAEGATFGAVLFAQKVSQAMMGFAIGQMLSWIGYDSSAKAQPPEVAEKIGLFLAIIPSILVFISVFVISALPLNKTSHARIVNALSKEHSTNRPEA